MVSVPGFHALGMLPDNRHDGGYGANDNDADLTSNVTTNTSTNGKRKFSSSSNHDEDSLPHAWNPKLKKRKDGELVKCLICFKQCESPSLLREHSKLHMSVQEITSKQRSTDDRPTESATTSTEANLRPIPEMKGASKRKIGPTNDTYGAGGSDTKRRCGPDGNQKGTNSKNGKATKYKEQQRDREVVCARWKEDVYLGVKERDTIYYCKEPLAQIDKFNDLLAISNKMRIINRCDFAKVGEEISPNNYFVVQDGYLTAPKHSAIIIIKQSQEQVISCLSSHVAKF
ncbi:unnamed protein product [Owenia fusiformis]|uniref:Uncharacterized protein n=1 Tax=Owenia fusiformis TaxID=6347 RepID=A0A8J1TZN7_OWEFU|nr:unnamed protein product [Owenia fusiformis]